jgi:hypothetical protein
LGGFIASFGLRLPYLIAGGAALVIAFLGFRFTLGLSKLIKQSSGGISLGVPD